MFFHLTFFFLYYCVLCFFFIFLSFSYQHIRRFPHLSTSCIPPSLFTFHREVCSPDDSSSFTFLCFPLSPYLWLTLLLYPHPSSSFVQCISYLLFSFSYPLHLYILFPHSSFSATLLSPLLFPDSIQSSFPVECTATLFSLSLFSSLAQQTMNKTPPRSLCHSSESRKRKLVGGAPRGSPQ